MTTAVSSPDVRVEQVMQDVPCPRCEYNLRGLYGPIVGCPECGEKCDVAKIVRMRWELAWYQAPKFNHVTAAVAWAVFSPVLAVLFGVAAMATHTPATAVAVFAWAVILGGWAWCLRVAYRVFDSWRGVVLALLAHVIFAAYLALLVLIVTFGIGWITAAANMSAWSFAVAAPLLAIAIVAAVIARRGERWIAEQCIREYLRRQGLASVATATMPTHDPQTEQ